MPRTADLAGRRFGALVVIADTGVRAATGHALWRVRCDCGAEEEVGTRHLTGSGSGKRRACAACGVKRCAICGSALNAPHGRQTTCAGECRAELRRRQLRASIDRRRVDRLADRARLAAKAAAMRTARADPARRDRVLERDADQRARYAARRAADPAAHEAYLDRTRGYRRRDGLAALMGEAAAITPRVAASQENADE